MGCSVEGIKKSVPCLILGPLLGYGVATLLAKYSLVGVPSAMVVGLLGAIMTGAQAFNVFTLVAATFVGANIYFGSGDLLVSIVLPVLGALMGLPALRFGDWISKLIFKED